MDIQGHGNKTVGQPVFKYYLDMKKADYTADNFFGGVKNFVEILGCFDSTDGIQSNPAGNESVLLPAINKDDYLFKMFMSRNNPQDPDLTCRVHTFNNGGAPQTALIGDLKITSKLIIECTTKAPQTNKNAYTYSLKVWEKLDGGPDYLIKLSVDDIYMRYPRFIEKFNDSMEYDQNINKFLLNKPPSFRLAIGNSFSAQDQYPAGKSNFTNPDEQMIALNVDPFYGDYGYSGNAWIAGLDRTSAATNLSSDFGPLTIYSDQLVKQNGKSYLTNAYKLNNELLGWSPDFDTIVRESGANFGTALFVGQGDTISVTGTASHGTGAQDSISTIKKNSQNFPQQYLSVGLPVNNITGNSLFGRANNFICPIS